MKEADKGLMKKFKISLIPLSSKNLADFISNNNTPKGYAAHLLKIFDGDIPSEITGRKKISENTYAFKKKVINKTSKRLLDEVSELNLSGIQEDMLSSMI